MLMHLESHLVELGKFDLSQWVGEGAREGTRLRAMLVTVREDVGPLCRLRNAHIAARPYTC